MLWKRTSLLQAVLVILTVAVVVGMHAVRSFLVAEPPRRATNRSGALEAMEFWSSARAYPRQDIPAATYYREASRLRAARDECSLRTESAEAWRFLGPTNFSGRMITVAVNPANPATLYAGSASGGLWRMGSDRRWERVQTGFPVLGVNAIAIDPADTNTIFLGTGEVYQYRSSVGGQVIRTTRGSYGMGILKSTDGARSWDPSLDWSYDQRRGVQAIRFNPRNTRTVFAATSEGVLRSSNAGESWEMVLDVIMARDLVVHDADTTRVLAACGNFSSAEAGVYASRDGGLRFEKITGLPAFSGMARFGVYAANPDLIYLHLAEATTVVGGLWRSTDFGQSWEMISFDNTGDVQGWYSRFLAVHPRDSSIILRGAQGLYRSLDEGRTFARYSGGVCWADFHDAAYDPVDPELLYIADDGGIWRTTDFGESFSFVGDGLQTSQFYNGFSCSAADSLLALGQVQDHFGWMYRGSESWSEGGVDEVGWTAINQQNDNVIYAGSRSGGGVYRSTDRGSQFYRLSSSFLGSASWNTPLVLSAADPSVLYFGRSRVYKSTDAGDSWFPTSRGAELDGNPPLSMAIAASSPDTVYVGTVPISSRAGIFRTTNGGSSWEDCTGWLPDRYPMDLAVDPSDSRVVYCAFGGFDTTRVARSTDAGETWADISGTLPNVPTTALAVDPFAHGDLYAGTDLGVFLTTDGGLSWVLLPENLPEALIVADLAISPSNRTLRLASHSNGVYERPLRPSLPTAVHAQPAQVPQAVRVDPNYPNPFNPRTTIRYALVRRLHIRLEIVDLTGRIVATLANQEQEAGDYVLEFDAARLGSGVYLLQLSAGTERHTQKMMLIR
jgi:photosystem II stability/assembly factor-like uncharacterized protein